MTIHMTHSVRGQPDVEFDATYGFDAAVRIREVFCKPLKLGSDQQLMLRQASMLMSIALQRGASIEELAHVLGEDENDKPARSVIGLMARAGVTLEQNIWAEARARQEVQA
ncbi:MAG TPA: hypothetical protein VHZ78_08700 [Rhizomicrobium sp.]|nr:hypothetical protein [Rhizomicrobium sp.]